MLAVLAAVAGGIGMISFLIRTLTYHYLEITNGYDHFPSLRLNLQLLIHYDKKVKPRQQWVKQVCNLSLRVGAVSFAMGILLILLNEAL